MAPPLSVRDRDVQRAVRGLRLAAWQQWTPQVLRGEVGEGDLPAKVRSSSPTMTPMSEMTLTPPTLPLQGPHLLQPAGPAPVPVLLPAVREAADGGGGDQHLRPGVKQNFPALFLTAEPLPVIPGQVKHTWALSVLLYF